jgi:hypothetical protein
LWIPKLGSAASGDWSTGRKRKGFIAISKPKEQPCVWEWKRVGTLAGLFRVSDYSEAKELGTVEAAPNGVAKLAAEFKDHLLLQVSSQP